MFLADGVCDCPAEPRSLVQTLSWVRRTFVLSVMRLNYACSIRAMMRLAMRATSTGQAWFLLHRGRRRAWCLAVGTEHMLHILC